MTESDRLAVLERELEALKEASRPEVAPSSTSLPPAPRQLSGWKLQIAAGQDAARQARIADAAAAAERERTQTEKDASTRVRLDAETTALDAQIAREEAEHRERLNVLYARRNELGSVDAALARRTRAAAEQTDLPALPKFPRKRAA